MTSILAAQEKLLSIVTILVNSADDTGCTEDLTVASKLAVEQLDEAAKELKDAMRSKGTTGGKIVSTILPIKDGLEMEIVNTQTGAKDQLVFNLSEQGSTYHLLVQKNGRGVMGLRELIDTIGEKE